MSDDLSNRINEAVDIFGGTLHGDFLVEVREEIERLRAENERLRTALEKIAQHDMQAVAMDALRPGERIREEK